MNGLKDTVLLAKRAARLPIGVGTPAGAEAISFDSGHAFPGILPDLTEIASVALTKYRAETLQYAPKPGLPELRDWIAEYMEGEGVARASAEEILVVNGAKHGLDLVCRLLLDEGDSIVVTAPTYFTAIPIFQSFGVNFITVSQDAEGLSVEQLVVALDRLKREGRSLPKFIYDVPDFHNPTGITMSRFRREALLKLATDNGIVVVEDSPYRKVRFEGQSQPSLKALDRANTVLMLGTFSKLLAPGLRIGWVMGPAGTLRRMVQLKSDAGTCPLTQRLIVDFCRGGHLPSHIERVQETYRTHRDRMVAAIRQEMPEVSMVVPQGGYYLWLTLPQGIDGDQLAARAGKEGVLVIPGTKFYATDGGTEPRQGSPRNHVRLAYSHASVQQIDEGIGRLARALHSMM